MVKIVKVKSSKKKDSKEDRTKKGLEYIKSLKKKKTEKPKKKKKKSKDDEESEADWANPKGVKEEDFGPVGKKEVDNKSVVTPLDVEEESESADWANPKGVKEEDFGPVGIAIEEVEELMPKAFKQIKTGVKGLDEILDGGIPENNLITVSGGPGSGKTILCLQYIYMGAKKYNQPGVFISLEEEPDRLKKTAQSFGWDYESLIEKKKIVLIKTPLFKFDVLKTAIRDSVNRIKAKRLVIDPGALFELFFDRDIEVRKAIVELGSMLKKLGCTTIVTTEEVGSASFNQGDFSADGIIYTYYTKISNQFMRMIAVIKMRGTSHSEKVHPLRFTNTGLEVLYDEEVFQDVSSNPPY